MAEESDAINSVKAEQDDNQTNEQAIYANYQGLMQARQGCKDGNSSECDHAKVFEEILREVKRPIPPDSIDTDEKFNVWINKD